MKVFEEEQRFTQVWLHIILIVCFIVVFISIIKEFIEPEYGEKNAIVKLIVVIGSMMLVFAIILSLKLKTRIDEKGIQFRFVPFHFTAKSISWKEIENAYVKKYNPISDYGGWGMKGGPFWRKGKGVAYNVKGNVGIQLELKTGKKILIGTQKDADVKRVLQTYLNKTNNS